MVVERLVPNTNGTTMAGNTRTNEICSEPIERLEEYWDLHGPECEFIRSSQAMQLGYGSKTALNCRGRLPWRITKRLPQQELRSFLGAHSISWTKTPSSWSQSTGESCEQPNARYSCFAEISAPDVVCPGNDTFIRPRSPLSVNSPNSLFPSRATYFALNRFLSMGVHLRMLCGNAGGRILLQKPRTCQRIWHGSGFVTECGERSGR